MLTQIINLVLLYLYKYFEAFIWQRDVIEILLQFRKASKNDDKTQAINPFVLRRQRTHCPYVGIYFHVSFIFRLSSSTLLCWTISSVYLRAKAL